MNYSDKKQSHQKLQCPICKITHNYNSDNHNMYGNETNCIICMERKCNKVLPCGHIFCNICLDNIIKIKKKSSLSRVVPWTRQSLIISDIENGREIDIPTYELQTNDIIKNPPKSFSSNFVDNLFARCVHVTGVYTIVYAGLGNNWYVRKNIDTSSLEWFFMSSDLHGQYGNAPELDHRQKRDEFIKEYVFVENYNYIE